MWLPLGNADYTLVTGLPPFLLPWRRISAPGSGWLWKPVRSIGSHKVILMQWNRVSCFCFRKWAWVSTCQSLPQEKRGEEELCGIGSAFQADGQWNRHFLVSVTFCWSSKTSVYVNFLNWHYNLKIVIPGFTHQAWSLIMFLCYSDTQTYSHSGM